MVRRLFALIAASCAIGGCAAGTGSSLRPSAPVESGAERGTLDPAWAERALTGAALALHRTFTRDGSEGLLALRLRANDVHAMFTSEGRERIDRLPVGLTPAPGETRWQRFRAFANAPLLGFCARGARVAEPNGPDGLRTRGIVVDRLLIVGAEPGGYWGAWIEGVVLTNEGWRLLPTIPFERQVETPRRDHSDVELWACDIGHRPDPAHPLIAEPPAE